MTSSIVRRIICAVLGLTLRIFFRRIEVAGQARVPRRDPVIFVLNHPNALVDPVFLLCLAPRRVSFLAKAPLFRMPIIGYLVRALDSLPVYRRQDTGMETSRNRETFELSRSLLLRGGTIAICPEGVSHNEPRLRPFKTGVARIALGSAAAVATGDEGRRLKIVPAGLYYTAKGMFRSAALLYFGEPVTVEPVALAPSGEPPSEAVHALLGSVERALREVTLNAEHEQQLTTIALAESIFSLKGDERRDEQSLMRELDLRRRFIEGYTFHQAHAPARLSALEARITAYGEELKRLGLSPQSLTAAPAPVFGVGVALAVRALFLLVFAPIALAGGLAHYPAYRLAGFFATKFSREQDDMVSTIKICAALLLFPLTWLCLTGLSAVFLGWQVAVLVLLITPLTGYTGLRFFEKLDEFSERMRGLVFYVRDCHRFEALAAERRSIRREILELGSEAARERAL